MIKAVINAKEVRARLADMSKRTRENTFKRVLRAAAKPVVQDLKTGWRGARRRKGKVTREIANAQQAMIRVWKKGDRKGTATLQIGTNYKRGGFAKVWHILENGFKHYGKNAVYRAEPLAARRAKQERDAYFDSAAGDIKQLVKTKEGREETRQRYRAIRRTWIRDHGDKERTINRAWNDRNARRADARNTGGNRTVLGRRISRPIAARHVETLAQRAQDLLVAEVMKAAKGRKAAA